MKRRELDRSKVPLLIDDLNRLLINYRNYCQKLKVFQQKGKFHNFFELHQHFVELYDKGHEYINEITIRIQVLNHYPVSALQNYLIFAEIEMPDNIRSIYQMIESIISDHKTLLKNMSSILDKADRANDSRTIAQIGKFIQYHEIQNWILGLWLDMQIEIHSIRDSDAERKKSHHDRLSYYRDSLLPNRIDK